MPKISLACQTVKSHRPTVNGSSKAVAPKERTSLAVSRQSNSSGGAECGCCCTVSVSEDEEGGGCRGGCSTGRGLLLEMGKAGGQATTCTAGRSRFRLDPSRRESPLRDCDGDLSFMDPASCIHLLHSCGCLVVILVAGWWG